MKQHYYFTTKGAISYQTEVFSYLPANERESAGSIAYNDDEDYSPIRAVKRDIPIEDIASILLFADITISQNALRILSQKGIPAYFFDKFNMPSGSFLPYQATNDGKIILLQSAHCIAKPKRRVIAAAFIDAAATNILKTLEYYRNRGRDISDQIDTITNLMPQIHAAKDANGIMLIEAAIRKTYYSAFNSILLANLKFSKREYNPPSDPVNAMLSFFNALLYSTIETELHSTKLSPFVSYLHEPGANRASLVWDISEIFKPIIVERLVFSLLNHKIIDETHFEQSGYACYLNKEGKKKAIKNYDEKINKPIFNRENNKHQSFRTIIKHECYKLINHIKGDKSYSPFKIWW